METDSQSVTSGQAMEVALAHYRSGRMAEAESIYRKALSLQPDNAEAYNNFGIALQALGRFDEAEQSLRQALALLPGSAQVHTNLGMLLMYKGRIEEAEQRMRQAVALEPEFGQAHNNLGILLHYLRRLTEAEKVLRHTVALEPDFSDAHNNLGVVLKGRGRPEEAELSFRKALQLNPADARAMSNLAETQKDTGRIEEAIDTYRRAIALEPGNASMHGDLLRALSYRPGVTLTELAESHAEFERRHALPLYKTWAPHENTPDPDRRLHLGFVSGDLGLHPIGYLMVDVLSQLDRRAFVVFVYSSRVLKDVQTDRLMQNADQWRDAAHLDDEALAAQIRADRIDVLIDLSGHTGDNRLLMFARRPAPIQITWMGYAGTTGLAAMDYLFTDSDLVPPEFDRYYSETIVRLPGAPSCYRIQDELPEVGPLPAQRNGFVTFGSFNNPAKITPEVVALWCKILTRLPTACMVLKYLGFDDSACRNRYAKLFSEGGVDPSRLTFLGHTPMAEMFARYNEVDIALDPFPYTGGTTTLLALAMGVPVITLPGDVMSSRQSLTILKNAGCADTVATSAGDYVQRALVLAGDLPRLAALRSGLRQRLLRSPIFDAPRFVGELEATFRELWRCWCENPSMRVRKKQRVELDSQMVTPDQAIEIALGHHRAGRLAEAERIYREVLQVEPEHPDALHLLGVAAHQGGAHQLAVDLIERADRLSPSRPEFLANLGAAYRALDRTADAERCYRSTVALRPDFKEAHNNLASLLRSLGRLAEAGQAARQAVTIDPDYVEALVNLAVTQQELGRLEDAETHLRRALTLSPDNAEASYNLGNLFYASRRLDEAEQCFRAAIALKPGFALAHNNLGNVLRELGRTVEAEKSIREALVSAPGYADAHYNLGSLMHGLRRMQEAEGCYRAALQLRADYAEAHSELGRVMLDTGRVADAVRCFQQAVAVRPDYTVALVNLGVALQFLGRLQEAEKILRQAIALDPGRGDGYSGLGCVLLHLDRNPEAEQAFLQALALDPNLTDAHNNYGALLMYAGRLEEAERSLKKALEIKPDFIGAMTNLAETLKNTGRTEESLTLYRRAHALEPGNPWLHSNLLLTLGYRPGITLAELAEAHAEFERLHGIPLRNSWTPHENIADPDRPLRLGFVSPDLGLHPIGYLMADVLALLDRNGFVPFVYSSRRLKDAQTYRLMQGVDQWRDVAPLDDAALAAQIRADRIDVLFDLSGHTGQNRLLMFARRPAPIQVTWMGYAATTGLSAMDYLLTDDDLVLPEMERYYSEKIVCMPGAPACYRLPDELPAVGPLPALRKGYVTFASFNNPAKITAEVVALWCKVLTRVPKAKLVLKYLGLDDPACRDRFIKLFAKGGVESARLVFLGHTPMAEMFARYNEVDITLDPFPYTGGTTTLLSLAMGVPVVTLPGEVMTSRQSLTMLKNAECAETVATRAEDYVQRAAKLAADLPELAKLRSDLRQRLLRSPFFDAPRFVRDLEATVRGLWRRWCENPAARGR